MFRILLIITLILLAVPFLNKAKNYVEGKAQTAKIVGGAVVGVAKEVKKDFEKK